MIDAQRPHVVQHVDRPPVGADHQVVVPRVQHQVAHADGGDTVGPADPATAPVERHPEAELGPQEQQIRVDRVLRQAQAVAAQVVRDEALEATLFYTLTCRLAPDELCTAKSDCHS